MKEEEVPDCGRFGPSWEEEDSEEEDSEDEVEHQSVSEEMLDQLTDVIATAIASSGNSSKAQSRFDVMVRSKVKRLKNM